MSAKKQVHGNRQRPSKASSTDSKSVSVNALKSRIRDVTRVLEHAQDLPLHIRIEKERALAGYRQDLDKAQNDRDKQRMIKKYHMVRFFERQKATRSVKRLRNQLAAASPDTQEYKSVEDQLHCAEVDLNYTLFYPLTEKYVSIFPRKETAEAQDEKGPSTDRSDHLQQDKPAMWKIVENCMESGTLEALRDGKLHPIATLPLRPPAPTTHRHVDGKKKHQDASNISYSREVIMEDGNESDGGFFENGFE
ncbi:MAG: hypothetical protein Q9219_003892 [cf. Caloplaca sp. 3 TL-2023]